KNLDRKLTQPDRTGMLGTPDGGHTVTTMTLPTAPADMLADAPASLRPAITPQELGTATDEDLLVRSASGDRVAFAELYDRVSPQVIGVALRVLRDRALAGEVAQGVLTEVWQKASRFDPDRGSAAGWIVT